MNEELVRCAQINFETLERVVPIIKQQPYYKIAKAQLDEALGGKTVTESLAPHLKEYSLNAGECSEIAHCFIDSSKRCACGEREKSSYK